MPLGGGGVVCQPWAVLVFVVFCYVCVYSMGEWEVTSIVIWPNLSLSGPLEHIELAGSANKCRDKETVLRRISTHSWATVSNVSLPRLLLAFFFCGVCEMLC